MYCANTHSWLSRQEPLRAVPELVFNLMTGCLRDMKTVHHEMTNGAWNPTIGRTLAGKARARGE